jgi:hypothetical protein
LACFPALSSSRHANRAVLDADLAVLDAEVNAMIARLDLAQVLRDDFSIVVVWGSFSRDNANIPYGVCLKGICRGDLCALTSKEKVTVVNKRGKKEILEVGLEPTTLGSANANAIRPTLTNQLSYTSIRLIQNSCYVIIFCLRRRGHQCRDEWLHTFTSIGLH